MGFKQDTNDPIIGKLRKGTPDDPHKRIVETLQVINGTAQLTEIPTRFDKVIVTGLLYDMYEVQDGELTENTFRVDYTQGVVFFHANIEAQYLVFNYMGRGAHFFPSSRIYLTYDKEFPNAEVKFKDVDRELLMQRNRIENLIQASPQPSEVVDIRVDWKGKVFPTSKARVDDMQKKMEFTLTGSNGRKYDSMSERFDFIDETFEEERKLTNMELANLSALVNELSVNLKYPPYPLNGCLGDGESDDFMSFQAILDLAKKSDSLRIHIPDGTYIISNTLRIHRNTTIEISSNATLVFTKVSGVLFENGKFGDYNYATGFNGDGNIRITGGTIDLYNNIHPPNPINDYGAQAIAFMHAENIHIENVKIKNGQNNHYIEVNACKNVRIINNKMTDQIVTGNSLYELIQIDMATRQGFPHFGAYDLTPCVDVIVQGNTFENCHSGIGTHTSAYDNVGKQVFHKNIRVHDNIFRNVKVHGIRAESWKNSKIRFNEIDTVGKDGMYILSSDTVDIFDNEISNITEHGILVNMKTTQINEPCRHIKLSANRIKNIGRSAIRIIQTEDITITSNEAHNMGEHGIHASYVQYSDMKLNTIRGVSQTGDGLFCGISLGVCNRVTLSDNTINNYEYAIKYLYMVDVDLRSSNNIISFNKLSPGIEGNINNLSPSSTLSFTPYEKFLTGILDASTGKVTLNDNINYYRHLIIATGTVSSGNLRHEIARGYFNNGFRINEDFINVPTSNGQFSAKVISEREIQIVKASDNLRYIIGVL